MEYSISDALGPPAKDFQELLSKKGPSEKLFEEFLSESQSVYSLILHDKS